MYTSSKEGSATQRWPPQQLLGCRVGQPGQTQEKAGGPDGRRSRVEEAAEGSALRRKSDCRRWIHRAQRHGGNPGFAKALAPVTWSRLTAGRRCVVNYPGEPVWTGAGQRSPDESGAPSCGASCEGRRPQPRAAVYAGLSGVLQPSRARAAAPSVPQGAHVTREVANPDGLAADSTAEPPVGVGW